MYASSSILHGACSERLHKLPLNHHIFFLCSYIGLVAWYWDSRDSPHPVAILETAVKAKENKYSAEGNLAAEPTVA